LDEVIIRAGEVKNGRHIFRHIHKEQTVAIVIRAEIQRCDSDSQTCVWTFSTISCVSHVWHTDTHMERKSQRNRPTSMLFQKKSMFLV